MWISWANSMGSFCQAFLAIRTYSPFTHDDRAIVVGYALTCKMCLLDVAATVEEARYQARKNGGRTLSRRISGMRSSITKFPQLKRCNRRSKVLRGDAQASQCRRVFEDYFRSATPLHHC